MKQEPILVKLTQNQFFFGVKLSRDRSGCLGNLSSRQSLISAVIAFKALFFPSDIQLCATLLSVGLKVFTYKNT